ncbi:hypothetical protein U1Q18_025672 [Sarracenia purpurea var. burkii]
MVVPTDKTRRGEKSVTSPAKGAPNAPQMVIDEEESDDNREFDKEELIYRQALIDKAQRLEDIQKMRSLRQEKGKGIA